MRLTWQVGLGRLQEDERRWRWCIVGSLIWEESKYPTIHHVGRWGHCQMIRGLVVLSKQVTECFSWTSSLPSHLFLDKSASEGCWEGWCRVLVLLRSSCSKETKREEIQGRKSSQLPPPLWNTASSHLKLFPLQGFQRSSSSSSPSSPQDVGGSKVSLRSSTKGKQIWLELTLGWGDPLPPAVPNF